MARYGNDFYGLAAYGTDTLVDFDARPFIASSTNYNEIFVEWNLPTGDWDKIRLVRNTFGFPMTPDDGDLLFEDDSSTDIRTYTDNGQVPNNSRLLPGQTYYYAIFVRRGGTREWVKAGNTLGVSVKRYGAPETMYEYIPGVQTISNMNSFVSDAVLPNNDLYAFLQIFGVEYDFLKTLAENIKNRYNVLNLDGRLIPAMLNQFGFQFENEIGIQQARVLLQNAVKIYAERGSSNGLKTFVSAFTGYNCDIKPVTNLMLSLNDSSFRESIGFWESLTNATLSRGTATTETPAVSPYEEPTSPSNFPNSAVGFLKVTVPAAGAAELVCGKSAILTRAIPVEPGAQYALSTYSQAKTAARNIVVDIRWYAVDGTFIGTAGEVSYTNTVASWTRSPAASGTAPATARFAVPYIRIDGATLGEIHYFDAVQFERGSYATTFVDARRIDIVLRANRINQIINPSFETDVSGWSVLNGTLDQITDGNSEYSLKSAKLTVASNGVAGIAIEEPIAVISNDQHAVSAYVKGPANVSASIQVIWAYEYGTEAGVTISEDVQLNGDWQRVSFETISPSLAATADIVIQFSGCEAGDEIQVDEVLFEKAGYVSPYFDGNSGYEQYGDVVWENGFDYNSRSHYYKNREVVTKRLIAVLKDYIPAGSAWAVFVGQPD